MIFKTLTIKAQATLNLHQPQNQQNGEKKKKQKKRAIFQSINPRDFKKYLDHLKKKQKYQRWSSKWSKTQK